MAKYDILVALIAPGLQDAVLLPAAHDCFRKLRPIDGKMRRVRLQFAGECGDQALPQKGCLVASFTGIGLEMPAYRIQSLPQEFAARRGRQVAPGRLRVDFRFADFCKRVKAALIQGGAFFWNFLELLRF